MWATFSGQKNPVIVYLKHQIMLKIKDFSWSQLNFEDITVNIDCIAFSKVSRLCMIPAFAVYRE